MKLKFEPAPSSADVTPEDWGSWQWQLRKALKSREDFARVFELSEDEKRGFRGLGDIFQVRATPYYSALAAAGDAQDPLRKILLPSGHELTANPAQALLDPLGERRNNPAPRIIHRYPDRVLFLVTDLCSVYCRYCTRKHFTGGEESLVRNKDYEAALAYIRSRTGVREIILSGGDPLTLSDGVLERILTDLRAIEHVEIIRIGTRMPVVCPMRVTPELVQILRAAQPVYMMSHFNHPRELTAEAATALGLMVDHGVPVFNQLVLLNGVNNHPAIIQALSRRLLFLRVKPYYMFQCDPSEGSDHLRTSVEESMAIQRELWGRLSGLAMPTLALDIPDGGGKTSLVPDFEIGRRPGVRRYRGWDGVEAEYVNPDPRLHELPSDANAYAEEWESLKAAKLAAAREFEAGL